MESDNDRQICPVHHSVMTQGVCTWCSLVVPQIVMTPAKESAEPKVPWVLTDDDRKFLKSSRISAEEV